MPRLKEEQITGFAHCSDARCSGYSQEEVPAVRATTEITFVDSGGDLPGVEKSHVRYRFENESDRPCPKCKRMREVTEQRRPVIQPISGYSQDGLLKYGPFNPNANQGQGEQRVAALEAKLAELTAKLGDKATA